MEQIMENSPNAFLSGIVGLLAGDLLGSAVNRFSKVLLEHINLGSMLSSQGPSATLFEKAIGTAFHVGLLAVSSELVTNALPWLSTEPSAYSMFMLGLLMTNETLRENLDSINRAFWLPSIPPPQLAPSAAPAGAPSS